MEKYGRDTGHHRYFPKEWWVTLVLAFVIATVLLVTFAVLYRNIAAISDTSVSLTENQLNIVAAEADAMFEGYHKICYILSANNNLRQYADLGKDVSEALSARYGFLVQKDLMSLLNIYGENINVLGVYFSASESVITMARHLLADSTALFFRDYPEVTPDRLEGLPFGERGGICLVTIGTHNWIVYKLSTTSSNAVYILLEYNLSSAVDRLAANAEDMLVLVGNKTQCLFSNGTWPDNTTYQSILSETQATGRFTFGQDYFAQFQGTKLDDLCVTVALPNSRITMIRTLLNVVLVITVVTVCLSLAVLLKNLQKKVFTPLGRLSDTQKDGYQDVDSMLNAVMSDIAGMADHQEHLLKERSYLVPLALGRTLNRLREAQNQETALTAAQSCMLLANIPQEGGFAAFSILCIEDSENIFGDAGDGTALSLDAMHFFIDNVLKDLLFEDNPGIVAPVSANHFLVLVSSAREEDRVRITEASQKLEVFYKENFDVVLRVTGVVGGVGAEALIGAVASVFRDASFLKFWGHDNSQRTEEGAAADPSGFHYYCNIIRKLIRELDEQNFEAIMSGLDSVLSHALTLGEKDIRITRYRMCALSSFTITAIEEQLKNEHAFIQEQDFEARLCNADNIAVYRTTLREVLSEVVRYKAMADKTVFVPRRMEDIRQYLNAHYRENSLSVSAVAQQFDINVSYLSRSFKEAYRINLLEYIQRLRVDEAKKLLRSNSVQNAAKTVGFWDAQGLIRAFKKYEGIAPGDYKKLLERESE